MESGTNGKKSGHGLILALVVILVIMCAGLGYFIWKHKDNVPANADVQSSQDSSQANSSSSQKDKWTESGDEVLDQANRLAAMYDYDQATELLKSQKGYETNEKYKTAVETYAQKKSELKKWSDNTKITHIFFHTLIVDTELAFDGDSKQDDYNQVMTTVDEFKKIIQEMYDRGYVLVRLHDIAKLEKQADGTEKMVAQPIMLPEGKKPFVLSQDDVSYYEYMKGDGFAARLVIDENGNVTNEYVQKDGTTVRGSYDVLPILEDFIKEHPDFSYRGAKGILALTGYNGLFGYRTSDFWYNPDCDYFIDSEKNIAERAKMEYPNNNIEQDKETAKQVAQAIKDLGWELASHSWGHPNLAECDLERFQWDTDMWEKEVQPILGDTDIILFPKGADVGTWKGYEETNERYAYLKNAGFDYFCNVDSSEYWVQITRDYFRQGRRNLDGTRMYEVICGKRDLLSDLFDAKEVFDPARPTPVKGVVAESAASEESKEKTEK